MSSLVTTSEPSFNGPKRLPISIEQRIAAVGNELARTVGQLLQALPEGPPRPQQVAKYLGVNNWLASRLITASQTRDPLAVAHLIPGPEPLRRAIKAAGRRKIDPDLLREAESSVNQFEELINSIASDRGGLDAIISGWVPEVRERFELLSKQAVFKGMSQIIGSASETDLGVYLLHPSDDGAALDQVALFAMYGLRRLRPGAHIGSTYVRLSSSVNSATTLDGDPIDDLHSILLPEYCSQPTPRFTTRRDDNITHHSLEGDDVGSSSAIDLVFAQYARAGRPRYKHPGIVGKASTFVAVESPTRQLVFDMLLHDDVYPESIPELAIYNTAIRGVARLEDPNRFCDRLDLMQTVSFLGRGITKFRASTLPRYVEMIKGICARRGWNPNEFRGYRCELEYPVFGSQIIQAFELPPPPIASA